MVRYIVDEEKMELWRKGELPDGWYDCKDIHGNIKYVEYDTSSNRNCFRDSTVQYILKRV